MGEAGKNDHARIAPAVPPRRDSDPSTKASRDGKGVPAPDPEQARPAAAALWAAAIDDMCGAGGGLGAVIRCSRVLGIPVLEPELPDTPLPSVQQSKRGGD